jgi:hypothetical protein
MNFEKHAANYDEGFMGKGSSRFYIDLMTEIAFLMLDAVQELS